MADDVAPWETPDPAATATSAETAPWESPDPNAPAAPTTAQSAVGYGERALQLGTGMLASVPAGVAYLGSGGNKDFSQEVQNAWTYEPRTAAAKAQNVEQAETQARLNSQTTLGSELGQKIDPSGNLNATAADIGERANIAAGALPALGLAGRLAAGGAAAEAAIPRTAEVTPPKNAPGPITAANLKNEPPRLPSTAAQEPPTAAAGAEGAPPPAAAPAAPQAPTAPPPVRFNAPDQEGAKTPSGTPEARKAALQALNQDAGGGLDEVRTSALTGNYADSNTDYQHARYDDQGGQRMKDVIAGENNALRVASAKTADPDLTGGQATGVDQAALAQRGETIDKALNGISDWFDKNVSATYKAADEANGGRPMQFPTVQNLLGDRTQFAGTDAGNALHSGAQEVAKRLGLVGDDGVWKPATVQQAEQFRTWANQQYTPQTGRIIGKLKDAVDSDVEAHGGPGLYQQGRALRTQQADMLEGPTGISRLLANDSTGINRAIPIEKIPDNIANMPRDQFNHVVNVLHDSAKLGNGELAAGSAAALNEIRGHMAARLHEAGSSGRDGMWDPYKYHERLNAYSQKMPAVFSPEGMDRFKTINDAGNVLRMDKRYPGGGAQIHNVGVNPLRDKIAHAVEGGITGALGPVGGAVSEFAGIGPGIRKMITGDPGLKHLKEVEGRITKLNTPTEKVPLGATVGGGKQRGAVGNLGARANMPAVTHDYDPATGEHTVNSANGRTIAQDTADGGIKALRSDTAPAAQRGGENTARLSQLADTAHAKGGVLHSDVSVSPGEEKSYSALSRLGYDVKKNPDAVRSPDTGNLVSNDPNRSVFSVAPKDTRPLGERLAGGKQRGAVGNPYDSAPVKKDPWSMERNVKDRTSPPATMRDYKQELRNFDWGNENVKNERLPQKEARTGNPYESGGGRTPLGQVLYGGKMKGRALGGPVDAGSPYVVGENGPEVIVPNKSGQVVPTAAVAQAKKMLKGAPPAGVNLSKVRYK
jgi:hypothetical protein